MLSKLICDRRQRQEARACPSGPVLSRPCHPAKALGTVEDDIRNRVLTFFTTLCIIPSSSKQKERSHLCFAF